VPEGVGASAATLDHWQAAGRGGAHRGPLEPAPPAASRFSREPASDVALRRRRWGQCTPRAGGARHQLASPPAPDRPDSGGSDRAGGETKEGDRERLASAAHKH
jgi:hypothetical protein